MPDLPHMDSLNHGHSYTGHHPSGQLDILTVYYTFKIQGPCRKVGAQVAVTWLSLKEKTCGRQASDLGAQIAQLEGTPDQFIEHTSTLCRGRLDKETWKQADLEEAG